MNCPGLLLHARPRGGCMYEYTCACGPELGLFSNTCVAAKPKLPAAVMAMSIAAKLEHEGTARRFRVPLGEIHNLYEWS